MRAICAGLLCAIVLSSCGRETTSTPTAPTPPATPVSNLPPASSVIGISIIGDMWIPTTASPVQQTARLITSNVPFEWTDGSDGVTWTIAPTGIANIDQHGRVTPIDVGTAVVTAKYGDKTGSNNIRVLPDYSGDWSGEFVITSCEGGNDPRECGRMMFGVLDPNGAVTSIRYPFTLALAQSRDQVSGTIREPRSNGEITAPVSGLVRQNGMLVLEATVPRDNNQPFRIFNWSSSANTPVSMMSGAFTQIEPRSGPFGTPYTVRTEQEFSSLSRAR